jgi:APA family basic amino acid/polyamine antiporter
MSKVTEKRLSATDPGAGSPTLLRQLGVISATALVVSNMVGTGIFTTTGFLAGDLGDPGLVLSIWLAGALFALAGAFCYSELGINLPSSGGEYVYLTRAYGPTWGFMSGWVSFFAGFSAPIAAAALAFSYYLGHFFPGWLRALAESSLLADLPFSRLWEQIFLALERFFRAINQDGAVWTLGSGTFALKLGGAQVVACGLIAVFTVLNFLGVRRVARIQNALTAVKLLVILAFVGLGFLVGTGNWDNFSQAATRTSTVPVPAQFAISLFWIYVCYSGWNAATYVAEELKHPERTLPIALTFGTAVVAAIYVALNVVYIYATPIESMKGVVAVGSLAAVSLFGTGAAGIFSALMALSLMATVNAMVTIGPRVYYAMAQNGAFFRKAAEVHPRWRTPVFAIACQGLCAMLMTLTPFPTLMIYIGFTLTSMTVLSVFSLFIFRRRPEWQKLRVVSIAFPLIPVFFILVGLWTIVYGVWLQPKISVAVVTTLATGALVYHFVVRPQRGR